MIQFIFKKCQKCNVEYFNCKNQPYTPIIIQTVGAALGLHLIQNLIDKTRMILSHL